ncbi:MAG: Y-family DNA polymerase [Candidatus Margulisbacteria bacterium]|nr:Y-family DNA polymerase [Candidatus Margulisiibacteriota bacterium]
MKTRFALVDCNSFYAACEQVFNPKIRNKPVIVLSNNDGCIVARSKEAKALGLKMAEPFFQQEDLIKKNNVHVFSSNYILYGDMSRRVMETLQQFTPDLEIYSIDEAFLAFHSFPEDFDLFNYGKKIKDIIQQWTGLPVSVGVGPTKTLAKLANSLAKKNDEYHGVLDLTKSSDTDNFLKKVPVGDIWGIGWQYTKFLNQQGIYNALELKNANDQWIKKHLKVTGLRTVLELRGTSCIPLEEAVPDKKGILCSRSFGRSLTELADLKEALATFVTIAAEKLRAQKSAATCFTVFVTTSRHHAGPQYANSIPFMLPTPTAYTPELISQALAALEKIFIKGYYYKKTGVMFFGLVPDHSIQLNLFTPAPNIEKQKKLMRAIDSINQEWGRNTIKSAATGIKKNWRMRQLRKSPRYTTCWEELLIAKAA